MTTFVQARDDLAALISTGLAGIGVPVFWENTLSVDLDKVGDRFIRIEIDFDDARQMTMNDTPIHETIGEIYFTVLTKEGLGTRATLALLDTISAAVKYNLSGRVKTLTPTPGRRDYSDGWYAQELRVPFRFNSLG